MKQSVHADVSCLECHLQIENATLHPDPANVSGKNRAGFEPDVCFQCHDDVQEGIETDKSHGGEDVDDVETFLNCIDCHDPHYEGAPDDTAQLSFSASAAEDRACLKCHQEVRADDSDHVKKNQDFCFSCHASGQSMPPGVPVMDKRQYQDSPHFTLDCLTCHPQAAAYGHDRQIRANCRQCHAPHAESVAHDAHSNVSCEACHLGDVTAVRDGASGRVLWERNAVSGGVTRLHNFIRPDGDGCTRCHFSRNSIGAAAMVLPAKSVLCMPCHPATLGIGDATTMISLAVFAFGLIGFLSLCFSCGRTDTGRQGALSAVRMVRAVFSSRIAAILRALWYDVLLQRRLYLQSPRRWAIHALIFWSMAIRFVWGIIGLVATAFLKTWPLGWVLIDKNHPLTALVFDLTGICLLAGIVAALVRGSRREKRRLPGLPSQDRLALVLIGGIVAVGYLLEGLRIALTGAGGPAAYAFIGYGISRLFSGMTGLNEWYGYVWYLHAILTGAFVAYLPFSRMLHIVMSPVVVAINAARKENGHSA